MNRIKYLIMDVDGTITDGKIYIGSQGEMMKAFSIKDGMVGNYILRPYGIVPVIITARNSKIVQNRCDELGITEVYQGKYDKIATLEQVVGLKNFGSCAYFGDDILDLKCMASVKKAGGIVGCPSDAVQEVKAAADYVCICKAGEGALREFAEWIVAPKVDKEETERRIKSALNYLKTVNITETDIGAYTVDDNFCYSVQCYNTKPIDECKLESHKNHVDIQIIVKGTEAMDIVDISRLNVKGEYDLKNDVMFWNIPERMARITLKEGNYIILYPENAHRGAIENGKKDKVLKIVGKVKIGQK